jgi:hypothetical protein
MYCHKCERAYDANARFCDVCELPLSLNKATPQFGGPPSYPANLASSPAKDPEELRGLGGWLIVIGIGLLLRLASGSFLILLSIYLFTKGTVPLLSDPHSADYIPGYTGRMEFDISTDIAFLAFGVLIAILFVKESRAFPWCFVALLGLSVICGGVEHWVFSHAVTGASLQLQQRMHPILHNGLLRIVLADIVATIQILYIVQSRRVKATFVH